MPADDEATGSYARISVVLFAAGFAGTVTNVSVTVVTSGLAREWNQPLGRIAVAILALNVSMAFAMPVAGLMAGRFGMRAVLVGGGTILGVATAVMLFADDVVLLTLGRLGQGAGLAAITPTAVQASHKLLGAREHARALGWWSAANGAGLALGPVLGGALLDLGGWAAVPLPTIAIAMAVVLSAVAGVPRGLEHRGSVRLYGTVMLSLMAGVAVVFLSAVSIESWVAAGIAGVSLAVVTMYALSPGRRPELPLQWLHDVMVRRSGTGASIQMFVNGMVQVAVPAWLVTAAITSSSGAGAVLLAMTLTMTVMGPVTGRLAHIAYRTWFRAGAGLCALGSVGLALADAVTPWWSTVPALVITGVGAGCLLTPSFQAFGRTVPGGEGVGLAMYNIMRLASFAVGGLVGAAAVDAGSPWAGFLAATIACLLAAALRWPTPSTHAIPADCTGMVT